jgi:hypothetical protein
MLIDIDRLREAQLSHDPFDHITVPGFIRGEALEPLHRDYPDVGKPGSFPVSSVTCGPSFEQALAEIQSPEMTAAIEEKFGVDLTGRPTMVTVRDRCRERRTRAPCWPSDAAPRPGMGTNLSRAADAPFNSTGWSAKAI